MKVAKPNLHPPGAVAHVKERSILHNYLILVAARWPRDLGLDFSICDRETPPAYTFFFVSIVVRNQSTAFLHCIYSTPGLLLASCYKIMEDLGIDIYNNSLLAKHWLLPKLAKCFFYVSRATRFSCSSEWSSYPADISYLVQLIALA